MRGMSGIVVTVCAVVLAGCGRGPEPPEKVSTDDVSPRGNETEMVGRVVAVDNEGNLQTDISAAWITSQREYLKMTIGGKHYPALFVCVGPEAVKDGEWAVWDEDAVLKIYLRAGRAAEAAGASVGTKVRLVKVDDPSASSPFGDGADILGTVMSVDKDGNLQTDVPFNWIAAGPTDKGPQDWDKRTPPEGQRLKVIIAGKEYPALHACIGRGAARDGEWVVVPRDRDMFRIDLKGGSAAETTGATVGTRVRLVKVGDPL